MVLSRFVKMLLVQGVVAFSGVFGCFLAFSRVAQHEIVKRLMCSVTVIGLTTVVFWLRSGVEPTIDLNQQRWKWAYSRTEIEQALGRAMLRTSQYQALVFSAS
jgi:hypothetical protein